VGDLPLVGLRVTAVSSGFGLLPKQQPTHDGWKAKADRSHGARKLFLTQFIVPDVKLDWMGKSGTARTIEPFSFEFVTARSWPGRGLGLAVPMTNRWWRRAARSSLPMSHCPNR
jgi:hypothetical protein